MKTKNSEKFVITVGSPRLTRFEKARILGARSLQLALGAPPFITVTPDIKDPISLALKEIEGNVLPLCIRRVLPNGILQDIPVDAFQK